MMDSKGFPAIIELHNSIAEVGLKSVLPEWQKQIEG